VRARHRPARCECAWPKISVIILRLNHDAFSQDAIASIINQDWPRRQSIVVDGGSTSVVLPNNFLENRLLAEHGGHRQ
jgi:GT2 family glycosyltransferase